MSEYLIQGSTLDNIAKPIQTLTGSTNKISLEQMKTGVENANNEISIQAEKIVGILDMLDGKTAPTVPTVEQATPSISVSSSGLITATSTQTEGYVEGGTTSATKQLTTQATTTWTPTTSNQTIASGTYLTGTQTIKGDSNLKAANIKNGVSIFGINGSYTGDGVKFASGTTGTLTATSSSNSYIRYSLQISNIGFVPTLLVVRVNATALSYTRQYELYFHILKSGSTTFTTYWEISFDNTDETPSRVWYESALNNITSIPGSAVTASANSFTAIDSISLGKDSGVSSTTSDYSASVVSWKAYGG